MNCAPCPFCGSDIIWVHLDEYNCAVAECNYCDARGPLARPSSLPDDEKLALAARLWNERVENRGWAGGRGSEG